MNFEMPVKCGRLKCTACTDPNYPGIDVEFVPEGATDNDYSPRVLVEWPKGDNDNNQTTPIRTLIWIKKEDYSFKEDLVFGNFTPHSWTPDEEPFLEVPLSVPARGGQIVLIPIEMRFFSGVFIGFIKHGASVPDNPFKDKSTPGVYVGTRRDDFRGPWDGIRTCITACTLNSRGVTGWYSLWYSDFGPCDDEPVVPLAFHEKALSEEVHKRIQLERELQNGKPQML